MSERVFSTYRYEDIEATPMLYFICTFLPMASHSSTHLQVLVTHQHVRTSKGREDCKLVNMDETVQDLKCAVDTFLKSQRYTQYGKAGRFIHIVHFSDKAIQSALH